MELDPDELLEALDALAQNRGTAARLDRAAMIAALGETRELAAGRPETEPAALFYTFSRRSARFGPAAQFFIPGLARAQAIANGFELDTSDVELTIHRARILHGEMEFLELRGWFAARLRPLGQKSRRSPPKRPR
jgi:hypothetical protein